MYRIAFFVTKIIFVVCTFRVEKAWKRRPFLVKKIYSKYNYCTVRVRARPQRKKNTQLSTNKKNKRESINEELWCNLQL